MPVQWTTVHVPLAAGLNTKADPRALQPPELITCKNAVFTETGGIQKRKPITAVTGGTLANIRKLYTYNDELIAFTDTEIYSWSAAAADWISKGTYLAPKVTERSVFIRTTEQTQCDRAEIGGYVHFAWHDTGGATAEIYRAVLDATTGAVVLGPTVVGSVPSTRPRFVALGSVMLIFYESNGALLVTSYSPNGDPAIGPSTVQVAAEFDTHFAVARLNSTTGLVVWRRDTDTSYGYATVSDSAVVTASTKARQCDGVIAVAVSANGNHVVVARTIGDDVYADLLNSSLTDVSVDEVMGATDGASTPDQLTAAFRSVAEAGGETRCYVMWHSDQTEGEDDFLVEYNFVDTNGATATKQTLVHRCGLASQAFSHNGRVFVWVAFAGFTALGASLAGSLVPPKLSFPQSTYFLYRDDGVLVAKAAPLVAGGFATTIGHLPGVQSLGSNTYAFCGVERRIVAVGSKSGAYADRGPRDIKVTFDSDEARRCVQLGKTLYIAGGQVSTFDGVGVVECGFHVFPFFLDLTASNSTGSLELGTYSYKATVAWENAQGELERSTTANIESITLTGTEDTVTIEGAPIPNTLKQGSRALAAYEMWRTPKNPSTDSPFHLITSKDPAVTGDNGYAQNDPTAGNFTGYVDEFIDSTLVLKEVNPENGGVLENIAPPPATIIAATQERLFLAGISYDPYQIWYSRLRGEGEIASFHDALTVQLPPHGGPITALAMLNDTLVAFCETAIYSLPGEGFDNLGQGVNFGPARPIATDVGAQSAEVVATTPSGILFLSDKGWFLLDRGFGVTFVGAQIEDFNSDTFVAVTVLETQHQIRCLSEQRLLVLDYVAQQWSEWEVSGYETAALWNGSYYLAGATPGGLFKEATTHGTDVTYSLIVETAWIKISELMGFQRIRHVMVLGEYRSAHRLKIEIARDFLSTYFDAITWTVSPTTVGDPEQVRHGPSIQKMEAIKVRLTDLHPTNATPPTGEALKLTGLAFEVGVKRGLLRLPAAQKQ